MFLGRWTPYTSRLAAAEVPNSRSSGTSAARRGRPSGAGFPRDGSCDAHSG